MKTLTLPTTPGAYRWLYADATFGEYSAVCIFMVGSLFSHRYVSAARKGAAPSAHSAVNFALYRGGKRVQWVLSEYPSARVTPLEGGGFRLAIGRSTLTRTADGLLTAEVDERPVRPFAPRLKASLVLSPRTTPVPEVPLFNSHTWQPEMVRAAAHLDVPSLGLALDGHGYHDGNAGEAPLGTDLSGWRWARHHTDERTTVHFDLPAGQRITIEATERGASSQRTQTPRASTHRTGWGLDVPHEGGALTLLESSPFYARLEGHHGGAHALGEVADFRRFRSPFIRWMAAFRTRVESREEVTA